MAGRNAGQSIAQASPAPESDTYERIFLAAERLFAERGFDGVSVRDIVQEAGVNLAAVSYHFGSKSALLMELFRARTKEMNRERHALLREAEAKFAGAPPIVGNSSRLAGAARSCGAIPRSARRRLRASSRARWRRRRRSCARSWRPTSAISRAFSRRCPARCPISTRAKSAGRCISRWASRINAPTPISNASRRCRTDRCDTGDVETVLERARSASPGAAISAIAAGARSRTKSRARG